jgi:hypothetical protein
LIEKEEEGGWGRRGNRRKRRRRGEMVIQTSTLKPGTSNLAPQKGKIRW